MAAPLKESLLVNENDLKSTLMSQKLRAEQHRTNYETLKAQHIVLQKEHTGLQSEYKGLSEQYEVMKSKCEEIIAQLQQERDDKIAECEEVRAQVLTGQKLEVIKLRIAEEIEGPYRKHIQVMENELETFRSDYNKMRYNYSFLKTEHENLKSKHQTIVEELQARHQAEISRYQEERRELLSKQEQNIPANVRQTRQLQRENTELEQKIKSLLSELEEKEGKMEQSNMTNEQVNRSLSRKVAELEATNLALDREAGTLREHIKRLQDEIAMTHKQHLSLSEEVMNAQRENTTLQRQMDELTHSHKTAISELTMRHSQECSDITRQKDSALSELDSCRSRIEVLEQAIQQQEASLSNMGREVEQRVQQVKEQEWSKIASLQQDKIQLEEDLTKVQQHNATYLSSQQVMADKHRDEMRQVLADKSNIKEELDEMRSQYHQQSIQLKGVQQELVSLKDSHKKYHTLQTEHHNVVERSHQLQSQCDKLQSMAHLLEEQLGMVKMELQKSQYECALTIDQHKKSWEEERTQLTSRLADYKDKQRSCQAKLASLEESNKKQRKLYKHKTQELKRKIELLEAKEEQLVLERDTEKKLREVEKEKMKRKFVEIQRRQKEFRYLLHQDHTQPFLPGESTLFTVPPLVNLTNQEVQHRKELKEVHERLEHIAASQTHFDDQHSISSDSLVSDHSQSL